MTDKPMHLVRFKLHDANLKKIHTDKPAKLSLDEIQEPSEGHHNIELLVHKSFHDRLKRARKAHKGIVIRKHGDVVGGMINPMTLHHGAIPVVARDGNGLFGNILKTIAPIAVNALAQKIAPQHADLINQVGNAVVNAGIDKSGLGIKKKRKGGSLFGNIARAVAPVAVNAVAQKISPKHADLINQVGNAVVDTGLKATGNGLKGSNAMKEKMARLRAMKAKKSGGNFSLDNMNWLGGGVKPKMKSGNGFVSDIENAFGGSVKNKRKGRGIN
jgi:hypothetical protein